MNKIKFVAILFTAVIIIVMSSCTGTSPSATTSPATVSQNGDSSATAAAKLDVIRMVGTIGPLSIPLAYMQQNNSLSSIAEKTELTIWSNPTQLQAIVAGGQVDFVSLPTNSAALFYNRDVLLKLLDSSIWNILYLITTDSGVQSLTELKGQRVVVPYQGAVPDAMFLSVCQQQGLDPETDLEIIYAPDPVQASQLLLTGQEQHVLLSEPSATSVILKGQSAGMTFIRALSMETEWQRATGGQTSTPVAGTIVLGNMVNRPEIIDIFTAEYQKAIQWMLDNPVEAGNLGAEVLSEQGFTAGVLTESLNNIDWRFALATDVRPDIEAFFDALSAVSSNFIGGKIPDDDFYYRP
jgi:NitT/TauT family transport system substrate-binding protein